MTATLTYNSIQVSGGLHAPVVTTPVTVTGGAIDLSLGNYYQAAVSGDTTFVMSNVPSGNTAFTLEIAYTGGVINWFSGVQWSNGISPIPGVGTITYTFITQDSGATWRAIASEVYVPPTVAPTPITLNLVGKTYATDNTTVALPAGTAAGDLCVYFDHPNTGNNSVIFSSSTPTSSGGSWTALGGTNYASGSSTGAYMWFRVLTAADISSGVVSGRSTPTTTSYRKKSLLVFRKSSGSISTVTVGVANGYTDTGADNSTTLASSSVDSSSFVLALMLVSSNSSFTVTRSVSYVSLKYSELISLNMDTANDIVTSQTLNSKDHAPFVIQNQVTKSDVIFGHNGGSDCSTVRNYLVVT